jgi:hypothetical protein
MKTLFFLIASTLALHAQKADSSLVCFTAKQVRDIAFGVATMKWKLAYQDTLINEQSQQLASFETLMKLKDSSVATLKRQVALLEANEVLHTQAEIALRDLVNKSKPQLYENPVLWCLAGLGTGYLLFHK